ncbi:MAG TPA: glycosyltransferase [Pseudonocardiaceae bacterium]
MDSASAGAPHQGSSNTGVTVVGIPARNEAATIGAVARTADAGLTRAFPDGINVIVLAENGSVDDTAEQFLAARGQARQLVVRSGAEGTGKGTNVFAITEQAMELGADRVVLLDADVRSTEPEWIELLARAVDGDQPTLAVPMYRRNRFEANTTNHLASPLLAAVFGVHVQQPIGGEFAYNKAFMERMRTWTRPASSYLYGIDIWLTGNALREGLRVVEVPLGRKLHNSPFPKILWLPQQVLDALFHVVSRLDHTRPMLTDVPPCRSAVDTAAVPQDPEIIARVTGGLGRYLAANGGEFVELFPSAAGLPEAPWGLRVGADRWPSLLVDALEALAGGHFLAARDHLIALYVNRVFSFWDEIAGLDGNQIDDLLDRVASATAAEVARRNIRFDGVATPSNFTTGMWAGLA